jgi:imidazolonepropionase-like amidohydrolase
VGSIEPGKDADLAVWSGYPLEVSSKVDRVFIDGKEVYTRKEGFLPWQGRAVGVQLEP